MTDRFDRYSDRLKAAQEAAAKVSPTSSAFEQEIWDLAVLLMDAAPEIEALLEAAALSAELAPRVPDGNKFGHDWTIPNPVIAALVALDAKEPA